MNVDYLPLRVSNSNQCGIKHIVQGQPVTKSNNVWSPGNTLLFHSNLECKLNKWLMSWGFFFFLFPENDNDNICRTITDEMNSSQDLLNKVSSLVSGEHENSHGFTPSNTDPEVVAEFLPGNFKSSVTESLDQIMTVLSLESLKTLRTSELFDAHQKLLSLANTVSTALKTRCCSPDKSWWLFLMVRGLYTLQVLKKAVYNTHFNVFVRNSNVMNMYIIHVFLIVLAVYAGRLLYEFCMGFWK
jgi:hypothetical protein